MNILEDLRKAEEAKRKALAKLHKELGYESAQALAKAILHAADATKPGPRGAKPQAASTKKAAAKPAAPRSGRRIPDEVRNAIKDALEAGEAGTAVAKKYGVSYPTIHNIKTELGLVKSRGKNSGKVKRRKKASKSN